MGIVVVGSVALDDVTTPFGRNPNAPGGSATYFSLSASNFTKVKLVAVVGEDFPKKWLDYPHSRKPSPLRCPKSRKAERTIAILLNTFPIEILRKKS